MSSQEAEEKEQHLCDARCMKCAYRGNFDGGGTLARVCCDYILITKHIRPCPAGEKCTVYDNAKRRKRIAFEEI